MNICTANVTAWSSFFSAGLLGAGKDCPAIWAIQEHRLSGKKEVRKARETLERQRYGSSFGMAEVTARGGRSGGTAVLWDREVGSSDGIGRSASGVTKREWGVSVAVGGLSINVVSFYTET